MVHATPETLVASYFRLQTDQKSALKKLGIITLKDLLYHLPQRYERSGDEGNAALLVPGTKVTLIGRLSNLKAKKLWKSRRNITEGFFEDSSGRVKVMWFNQPYIASYVKENVVVKVTGTVGGSTEKPYIANPEVEQTMLGETEGLFKKDDPEIEKIEENVLFPVYPESRGVSSRWIYHAVKKLFQEKMHEKLPDPIPQEVLAKYNLPALKNALMWMHVPEKLPQTEVAKKRFSFEEIFALQLARAFDAAQNATLPAFALHASGERVEAFFVSVGITPTGAQRRAVADILESLEKPHPMARLLEGDVGSGKTLVAAAAAYAVVTARPPNRQSGTLQVGYMAPTEILAAQHFESFVKYFSHLPINIALMTGSGCQKFPSKLSKNKPTDISRAQLKKWIQSGEIAMLVGTHALIQKSVEFQHLALVIVDEQHRFGVNARKALAHKGDNPPHFLSMTATPIPRTLALTMYGDLDLSVLDELPPGRAKVTTKLVSNREKNIAYDKMREQFKMGRQAYVICPRIDEPDPEKMFAMQATSAKAEAARLQKDVFPEYTVGLMHGQLYPHEKDAVMDEFKNGKVDILVATSVVEVGVNVTNATVIAIEGAERFGLAQLHQLRGRVQRSSHPPFCYLFSDAKSAISIKRLKALEKSDNGFELAEADLALRGSGDLYGLSQWGVTDLAMEALKNPRLIEAARTEAQRIVKSDPFLEKHPLLKNIVESTKRELHKE